MEIIKAYMTQNPCYKKNKACKPVGILVHATGAVNRELRRYVDAPDRLGKNQYNNHWNSAKADKCVHAFIGYDKDKQVIVAETLPHHVACWGCGKGKKGSYNYDPTARIQFEICQGSNTDAAYYKAAIAVAEEYCAHLCKLYGWTADKITSHKEAHDAGYASNHGDPQSWMKYFGDDMNKFRARVQTRLNGSVLPSDAPNEKNEQIPMQKPEAAPDANYAVYTVQRGDSLWKIAKAQLGKGSRYKEIKALNGLTSDTIHAGQKLKIPKK